MVDIVDGTAINVDNSNANQEVVTPETDVNDDSSTSDDTQVPWGEDSRWKAWRNNEKKVNELMEEHDFDNIDVMLDAVAGSKQLQEKLGTHDIEALLKADAELTNVKAFWAENEMKKKKDEDPEAYTIELENKLKDLEATSKEEAELKGVKEQNDRYLNNYNNSTDSFIEAQENMTQSEKEFFTTVLRYNSFLSETDINNKASVKNTLEKVASMMDKMRQDTIEGYRAGKIDIPKMSATDTTLTTIKEKIPKTFEEAKAQTIELLKKRRGI